MAREVSFIHYLSVHSEDEERLFFQEMKSGADEEDHCDQIHVFTFIYYR